MKRMIALVLSAVLLLSLSACGEASQAPTGTGETTPVQTPTEPPITPIQMEETVIVDNEQCTFTITGMSENDYLGMTVDVFCENKTEKPLMFTWNNTSVCGYMYDPFWAEEVEPGKKSNTTLYLDTYQLEQMGITSIDEITFTLYVYDSEDFMAEPLVDEVFSVYPTGLTADTVTYPVRAAVAGETVIVDNENLSFIIESVDTESSSSYTLRCYVNNKTDRDVIISWDGVSVNDFMIDPYWATVIAAGKQAYTDITFSQSDLEANNIESVEQIAFTMTVMDNNDWTGEYLLEETYTYEP